MLVIKNENTLPPYVSMVNDGFVYPSRNSLSISKLVCMSVSQFYQ